MKNKWLLAVLFFLLSVVSMMPAATVQAKGEDCVSPKSAQLKTDMQKAWIDHTIWTRSYIVSALADLEDQQDVLDRLLQNQQDIGNLIKPYYGEAVGDKLADLLREHIVIAGKIVAAAKADNEKQVKTLATEWHRNADDIAKFLSEANPNWQFTEMRDMLYTHLKLITEVVQDRINRNWKADIAATDKNEVHMIHFADMLAEGIVKQFPDKF